MRAADALCEALKAEGVEHVFGIPGGANLPTYDALYDADLTHIQARHEQGAGHAAEGYAKASGRVGVAFATSGPGRDQPGDRDRRRDDGLGADRVHHRPGPHRPDRHRRLPGGRRHRDHAAGRQALVPGHRTRARSPSTSTPPSTSPPPGARARCWSTSRRTSRGPTSTTSRPRGSPNLPGYKPPTEGNIKQIRIAAKALANARRPVIYGGGGIINANASEEFREFCASDRFPVTLTVMGLGAFPAPHEQWLGMLGMHGTRTANYAMDEADLIVAVGARFDDRITGKLSEFAPRAKFVHIDVDPAEISKNVPAHIPIVGDAKDVLPKLTASTGRCSADSARLDEWWKQIRDWQTEYPLRYEDSARLRDQAAVHDRGDVRGDRGRRDHHLRRRPAPDVGGAVLPLLQAPPVDQLRRPRHDGLRPAGGDRRQGRAARTRRSSASPATAA